MEYKAGHWLVHEECIVCTAACTSRAEEMLDSKKIKLVAIAVEAGF